LFSIEKEPGFSEIFQPSRFSPENNSIQESFWAKAAAWRKKRSNSVKMAFIELGDKVNTIKVNKIQCIKKGPEETSGPSV
jgi:hypothetical protein